MRRFHLGHFALAVVVFVADQVTKGWVERMPDDAGFTVVPGLFRIIHVENPGVAFGLFQSSSPAWHFGLIVASSLALLVVLSLLWRTQPTRRSGFAVALIVSGACGNLFDRILHGRVVDFLLFYRGSHSWPAFNLADSAIVIGAGLLVFEIVRDRPQSLATAPSNTSPNVSTPL